MSAHLRAEQVTERVLRAVEEHRRVALATMIAVSGEAPASLVGLKMIVGEDGATAGTFGLPEVEEPLVQDCLRAFSERKPVVEEYALASGGTVQVFVEVLGSPDRLIIVGAGHVAVPLARFAKLLGFEVIVVDDRQMFANRQRFPDADQIIAANMGETLRSLPISSSTYLVLVTRGHTYDEQALRHVIKSPAAYIGMIGSKRRVSAVFQHLIEDGFSKEIVDRVYAPIGLDLGAETPAEIAMAIAAELVKVRRGGTAPSLALFERRRARALRVQEADVVR